MFYRILENRLHSDMRHIICRGVGCSWPRDVRSKLLLPDSRSYFPKLSRHEVTFHWYSRAARPFFKDRIRWRAINFKSCDFVFRYLIGTVISPYTFNWRPAVYFNQKTIYFRFGAQINAKWLSFNFIKSLEETRWNHRLSAAEIPCPKVNKNHFIPEPIFQLDWMGLLLWI